MIQHRAQDTIIAPRWFIWSSASVHPDRQGWNRRNLERVQPSLRGRGQGWGWCRSGGWHAAVAIAVRSLDGLAHAGHFMIGQRGSGLTSLLLGTEQLFEIGNGFFRIGLGLDAQESGIGIEELGATGVTSEPG
jgi:hypothetical protein